MRLKCNKCGKVVSTEIPVDTVVRAWLQCPECVEYETNEKELIAHALIEKYMGKVIEQ